MFKPPKGIKYGAVSEEELTKAMDDDDFLVDIAAKRIAIQRHIKDLKAELSKIKAEHKKSFWSLYKAECDLTKAKMRGREAEVKLKNSWTKRTWELFKVLKFKKWKK